MKVRLKTKVTCFGMRRYKWYVIDWNDEIVAQGEEKMKWHATMAAYNKRKFILRKGQQ